MIYIVEDDENIREMESYALKNSGYDVKGFACGDDLRAALATELPRLILLDIMLPEEDGISVLKWLRSRPDTKQLPVIMLTAKSTEYDKVVGLDSGADDYLTKPFATDELLARIRALGRRSSAAIVSSPVISCGDVSLDSSSYELSSGGSSVKLGLKEFSIMELLMKNAGTVISKETLITKIWGYESDAEYNNVEVYISFLRKKLSFIKSKATIKTLRGVGYSFSE